MDRCSIAALHGYRGDVRSLQRRLPESRAWQDTEGDDEMERHRLGLGRDALRALWAHAARSPSPLATREQARGLLTSPGRWHAATGVKWCRTPHGLAVLGEQKR